MRTMSEMYIMAPSCSGQLKSAVCFECLAQLEIADSSIRKARNTLHICAPNNDLGI